MDEIGFKVTRLVDLDLVSDANSALAKCLESGIDVFITCPQTVSVWAIPNDFTQSVDDYKIIKERGFPNPLFDIHASQNTKKLPLSPSLVVEDALLLQLRAADIKRLLMFNNTEVIEFQKAYAFDIKGGFKLIDSITSKQYLHEKFMPEVYRSSRRTPLDFSFVSDSDDFQFVLCDKSKLTIDKFNDPLNHQKPINIGLKDCFVCLDSAKPLTEYRIHQVPENSPYFVPEDCRSSSKLNKLAILGHRFYKDKTLELPENMSKHIECELSVGKKEAETAAFFISPDPKGEMSDKFKCKPQFKHLIEVYKEFYNDGKLRKEKNNKGVNQRIINSFDSLYGYSDEKCRYAVKLITPDN